MLSSTSSNIGKRVTMSLKDTLKLPKTSFPLRQEPQAGNSGELFKRCTEDLYRWQSTKLPADELFVLHDGPPYANGLPHMGHALNKILKDFTVRHQIQKGRRVSYVPGWDCHGLPIELKALQGLRSSASGHNVSAAQAIEQTRNLEASQIRTLARKLALGALEDQKAGFKSWAVMGDWDNAWTTMDLNYELNQLQVFREMLLKGLIYRQFKPVYWSPSSKTALAEAELEYKEDHESKAATVKFPVVELGPELESLSDISPESLGAVIWTTTPWTLLSNKAITFNPALDYCVVSTQNHGQLLAALSRIEHLQKLLKEYVSVITTFSGSMLKGVKYRHPLFPADAPLHQLLAADYVTSDTGTGLVHCAPGHGTDDYLTCLANGIQPFSPVDDEGKYTADVTEVAAESGLEGKAVLNEGNDAVLDLLREKGCLLGLQPKFTHKYPYDWRTKLPVIQRSTAQWFADVGDVKSAAIEALINVKFVPEGGRSRLEAFVTGRSEWCISRQRSWGVPIPVLHEIDSGEPLLTGESVEHIISVFKERGSEAWWSDSETEEAWVPPSHRGNGKSYKRGRDTMDVWFDSGTSWKFVESTIGPREGKPLADVYLEGSDQHRGWFQSSLLTAIAASKPSPSSTRAPFATVLTHGFILDDKGRKMAKSEGNTVAPQEIIDGSFLMRSGNNMLNPKRAAKQAKKGGKSGESSVSASQTTSRNVSRSQTPQPDTGEGVKPKTPSGPGVDALRLWVAFSDYTKDISLGEKILRHVGESLRKIRVTFRFFLGNLSDWNGTKVSYEDLTSIDKYALYQLAELNASVKEAYDELAFNRVANEVTAYTNAKLSAFYLDVVKDRLYASDGKDRAAVQTTLYYILQNYLSVLAPIIPLLTEELWSHTPDNLKGDSESPCQLPWFQPRLEWQNEALGTDFKDLEDAGDAIKYAMEEARTSKVMKSSLEAEVVLVAEPDGSAAALFKKYEDDLANLFISSSVTLATTRSEKNGDWEYSHDFTLRDSKCVAIVRPPSSFKCPRCWVYSAAEEGKTCQRCDGVVKRLNIGIQ